MLTICTWLGVCGNCIRLTGYLLQQVFSLIGDFFSPHQRAFVAALVQIAMGAGMSLGQLVAGVLGERRCC